MSALALSEKVGVIGAGAMGAGIAQVAAMAGHTVLLHDAKDGAAQAGIAGIAKFLARSVEKGKMSEEARDGVLARLVSVSSLEQMAPCALVVEAIVENLGVKRSVFQSLEKVVGRETILATNTSSISVTSIANGLQRPQNLVGMHFFNPAPLMKLVEVVSGLATARDVAQTIYDTAAAWGKAPVHAKSTPGFIVNRVARPFYAEGLRVLQEGGADVATIDALAREAGGFRMGPFELMDLIGHDVNFAVTNSVWNAFYNDARFLPSLIQQELVEAGWLGRKTGRGFYDYADGAEKPSPRTEPSGPVPELVTLAADLADGEWHQRLSNAGIDVDVADEAGGFFCLNGVLVLPSDGRAATERAGEYGTSDVVLYDLCLSPLKASRIALTVADQAEAGSFAVAAGLFQAAGLAVTRVDDVPGMVLTRTVAMLANEAAEAVNHGVASARDADIAMTKGVNYPIGPLAWAEQVGLDRILVILENLQAAFGEDRYRPSTLLTRKVTGGSRFHD